MPLVFLSLLVGVAQAATLESELLALQQLGVSPILVAATGRDDTRSAERIVANYPGLALSVVTIPTVGDRDGEMALAMKRAGISCAVRVTAASQGGLSATRYGVCLAAGAAATPTMTLATAPNTPAATPLELAVAPPPTGAVAPAAATPVVLAATPIATAPIAPPSPSTNASSGDLSLLRAELWQVAAAEAAGPDPTAALMCSALVGFGSGHFYAGDTSSGTAHLAVQGGALLVSVIALGVAGQTGSQEAAQVYGAGIAVMGIARVVEMWTAPGKADATATARLRRPG